MYEEIVKKIKEMPPLSASAVNLLQRLGDERAGPREFAAIVARDPSLTMNVLRVVNAPAFGLGTTVASIDRAVALLGVKNVVGVALMGACPAVFAARLPGYEAERGDLWRHCLFSAMAAREFAARAIKPPPLDLAYTGGVLHDVGKAVLSFFLKDKTAALVAAVESGEAREFRQAEQALVGGDHAEAGYALAVRWNLPKALAEVIRRHHAPMEAPEELRPLVFAVHLADIAAMSAGHAAGADGLLYRLEADYARYIPLTAADLEDVMLRTSMEFEKLQAPGDE